MLPQDRSARTAWTREPAMATTRGQHTPHLLDEALSWHVRYLRDGTMKQT